MSTSPLGYNTKTGKPYKVMVIDDSSTIRIAERKILLSEKFDVILEADGAMDALTKLREAADKPDIIMTDFDMPQMNGIDLLKRIRALNIDSKIIVVTSYANKGVLMEFLKLKVDGYIVKPVQRQTMIYHLARVIGREDYLK
ncbi:response regulator [Brachyspira hampsonii]|uniref:Chemotaxis response regulator CheY n=1 Tax=Brachyspira hampsonii 30446 TaxID=1289135 RepID=A0A2U4EZG4_9SPIR|nr:response regulator [Brachyspira hampsonii]EKV57072.1 chemotaxis response regulator CheY [Brachyspira hampsonii 30446]MBW5389662.1 response regulator [Brachyspira hampsonii]MBW5395751.1 response regulator [Brachyspira hampsonii]OEJ19287.1 histidine kinase [Brachyspira hampsonii]